MPTMTKRSTHISLERGLAVLEFAASMGRTVSLAETARHLELHRSTCHHIMQALVRADYLRQRGDSRTYELTTKIYDLLGPDAS